jgi:hypothetical protein
MARDIYHEVVKEALITDGWTIENAAYVVELPTGFKEWDEDFEYNEMLLASKDGEQIFVNPKSFLSQSLHNHFQYVLGECLVMKHLIEYEFIHVAMPDIIYNYFKKDKIIIQNLQRNNIRLTVFNPETKRIEKWIK